MKKTALIGAALLTAIATPALAHTGGGAHVDGFLHGLAHPVGGLDHLIAMVAVGAWAAVAMPQRPWLGPLAFVVAMLAGAGIATLGIAVPMVELGIVGSVIALGLMIAFRLNPGLLAGAAIIAIFAIFHGNAHGLEAAGAMTTYMAGFTISTAVLHGIGVLCGWYVARGRVAVPALGSAVAAAGIVLLVV